MDSKGKPLSHLRAWYHGGRIPDQPPAQQRRVCGITEHGDISTRASVVVIRGTESIKGEAIWDEVHLRMKRRTHRVCNGAELGFEHC